MFENQFEGIGLVKKTKGPYYTYNDNLIFISLMRCRGPWFKFEQHICWMQIWWNYIGMNIFLIMMMSTK